MRQQREVLIRDHCSSMEPAELFQVVLKQRRHLKLQKQKRDKISGLYRSNKNSNDDNMNTCIMEWLGTFISSSNLRIKDWIIMILTAVKAVSAPLLPALPPDRFKAYSFSFTTIATSSVFIHMINKLYIINSCITKLNLIHVLASQYTKYAWNACKLGIYKL